MTKTMLRWEQDGSGGVHGIATYFPGTRNEISLRIDNFPEANALFNSIEAVIKQNRWDARAGLLAEIGRMKP